MIIRNYILATLTLVFAPILAPLAFGDSDGKHELIKKTIICGDAEVTAETMYIDTKTPEIICTRQKIKLVNQKKGVVKILPLDGKLVKKKFKAGPVLDAVATSVGCLKSKAGTSYILLWYQCNWGQDCCGDNREWQRLFSVDGTNLTLG